MVIDSAWGIISERNVESTEDDIQISEDSDNQDGVTSNKPKKRAKRYPCPKCGKGFAQFPSATKHCLNTPVEKGVSCHICGIFIKLKKNLKRHLNDHKSKVVSRPSGSSRCEGCGRCFSTLQRLTSHMESKHGVKHVVSAGSSEVFSCSLCSFSHVKLGVVKTHFGKNHAHDKELECDNCDYKCYSKSGLNKHRAIVHKNTASHKDASGETRPVSSDSIGVGLGAAGSGMQPPTQDGHAVHVPDPDRVSSDIDSFLSQSFSFNNFQFGTGRGTIEVIDDGREFFNL